MCEYQKLMEDWITCEKLLSGMMSYGLATFEIFLHERMYDY